MKIWMKKLVTKEMVSEETLMKKMVNEENEQWGKWLIKKTVNE